MAKGRKTIEVARVLEEANRLLALKDNKHVNADFRAGVAAMIEHVLHSTDNYAGYNFIEWIHEGGYERWVADGRPLDGSGTEPYLGDQTRRFYYASSKCVETRRLWEKDNPKGLQLVSPEGPQ